MDKAAVLAAATAAKLPVGILEKLAGAEDNGLVLLLTELGAANADLSKQVTTLTAKAAMGDAYLLELKADTIGWFVKANQTDAASKGVSTDTVERLLAACGENVDLIKALREQYTDLARAKFPESVRRSTFPDDANSRTAAAGGDDEDDGKIDTTAVTRIHS